MFVIVKKYNCNQKLFDRNRFLIVFVIIITFCNQTQAWSYHDFRSTHCNQTVLENSYTLPVMPMDSCFTLNPLFHVIRFFLPFSTTHPTQYCFLLALFLCLLLSSFSCFNGSFLETPFRCSNQILTSLSGSSALARLCTSISDMSFP